MLNTSPRARFVAFPGVSPSRTSQNGLFARLRALIAAHNSRVALANLDQFGLDDVGLTRRDAAQDLAQPLWDVPNQWRR